MAAKSPPALPSFSGNWVGGDIHGLWSFSATLYRYVPQLADVVTALDKNVSGVVGTAGWRGKAASAFTTSWDRDATAARALGVLIDQEGDVTGELAYNLATIEHALESAAQQVQQAGVPVGPDGQPPEACSPARLSSNGRRRTSSSTRSACRRRSRRGSGQPPRWTPCTRRSARPRAG